MTVMTPLKDILSPTLLRVVLLSLFSLLLSIAARGQYAEPLMSQYYEMPAFYNPGRIGCTDFINVRAGGRLQWVGIDNAPVSIVAVGDMPVRLGSKRMAVGLALQHESYGLYRNMTLGAMVGYKIKLFGGILTPGLRIGILNQSFRGSEVYIPDDDDFHNPTDEAIPTTDVGGNAFDLGAGIGYERKGFTAGVSILHANSPKVRFTSEGIGSGSMGGSRNGADNPPSTGGSSSEVKNYEFPVSPTLYFSASGNIPVKNTLFEVIPSLIIASDFSDYTGIATARFRYNRMVSAGLSYRYRDGVALHLGLELKNFYVGYTYEYPLSAVSKASSGSHELLAGYSFKLNLGDKNKNKQKSIRIL